MSRRLVGAAADLLVVVLVAAIVVALLAPVVVVPTVEAHRPRALADLVAGRAVAHDEELAVAGPVDLAGLAELLEYEAVAVRGRGRRRRRIRVGVGVRVGLVGGTTGHRDPLGLDASALGHAGAATG